MESELTAAAARLKRHKDIQQIADRLFKWSGCLVIGPDLPPSTVQGIKDAYALAEFVLSLGDRQPDEWGITAFPELRYASRESAEAEMSWRDKNSTVFRLVSFVAGEGM